PARSCCVPAAPQSKSSKPSSVQCKSQQRRTLSPPPLDSPRPALSSPTTPRGRRWWFRAKARLLPSWSAWPTISRLDQDKETRRRGDKDKQSRRSPCLLVSPSPCLALRVSG